MNDASKKSKPAAATTETTTPKLDLRVYPVLDAKGNQRFIKAKNVFDAVVFVYQPKIGRPLSGTEVSRVYEEGGKVETVSYGLQPAKKEVQA
jgi:hypothetical protein